MWRLDVLTSALPDLLRNCFTLLNRLSEVESSVRLLQLISVIAEAAGEKLQPHLGPLAAALPQVRVCSCKAGQADIAILLQ